MGVFEPTTEQSINARCTSVSLIAMVSLSGLVAWPGLTGGYHVLTGQVPRMASVSGGFSTRGSPTCDTDMLSSSFHHLDMTQADAEALKVHGNSLKLKVLPSRLGYTL